MFGRLCDTALLTVVGFIQCSHPKYWEETLFFPYSLEQGVGDSLECANARDLTMSHLSLSTPCDPCQCHSAESMCQSKLIIFLTLL